LLVNHDACGRRTERGETNAPQTYREKRSVYFTCSFLQHRMTQHAFPVRFAARLSTETEGKTEKKTRVCSRDVRLCRVLYEKRAPEDSSGLALQNCPPARLPIHSSFVLEATRHKRTFSVEEGEKGLRGRQRGEGRRMETCRAGRRFELCEGKYRGFSTRSLMTSNFLSDFF
jgi:hypothetical protein